MLGDNSVIFRSHNIITHDGDYIDIGRRNGAILEAMKEVTIVEE